MSLFVITYSERSDPEAREREHSMIASDRYTAVTMFKADTKGNCRVLNIREL